MDLDLVARNAKVQSLYLAVIFIVIVDSIAIAQQKTIDGKDFTAYKSGAFKPNRGLFYSIYLSPVLTIDPLGLGGKSTYALSLGTRINLWESRSPDLKGLKIKGWYVGGGYEYYPQQFDMVYLSLWLRVKTFIPLVGKIDAIYAFDGTHSGMMSRYCIGVEVRKLSLFLCGTSYGLTEDQPINYSEYTTAGSILLVIPIYTHD